MTKKQARKLRDKLRLLRKQLGRVEERCWHAQKKIEKRLGMDSECAGAHDLIGAAINRVRDELETAAYNINAEIGVLR